MYRGGPGVSKGTTADVHSSFRDLQTKSKTVKALKNLKIST